VQKIDPRKAYAYYLATQGWSKNEVRQQVLTPIEQASLLGTPKPDPRSIMCYQIPGGITKDGKAIIGGRDIDRQDHRFAAQIYPKAAAPRRGRGGTSSSGRARRGGSTARRRRATATRR
jgi:hypothetical protein